MKRRDFFKAFSMGGAVLAAGKVAKSQSWGGPGQATDYVVVNDGHSGPWPHWPFEEIRIPFAERFGKIRWPNNGPLCVYMYVTGEWGGHRMLNDSKALYKRDLRLESETGQYEFNVGIWRAIRLLDKYGIKVSFAPHAGMVEKFPALWRDMVSKGHEITARTFSGEPTTRMSPAEEKKEIQLITKVIEKATGKRPVGFDNPGGVCTEHTPEYLADEGYIYISGLKGDDLPYGIKTRNGKIIIVVGSRHTTSNDNAIFGERGDRDPEEAFRYMKAIFDAYYKLGKEEMPQAFNYGIHPAKGAMPDRIGFQHRFVEYMLNFKDVWWARYDELAEYWMKSYIKV